MEGFTLDDTVYPIIKIVSTGEDITLEGVIELDRRVLELIESNSGKFVTFFDATKGKWAPGDVRIAIGKSTKRIEEKYADRLMRSYIIAPNPIIKMMIKGVNLVSKPQVEQVVHSKADIGYAEALAFVKTF